MKIRMHSSVPNSSQQSGAALVVSMVLLMVLTLLAISTMNTASLEVAMAGNSQQQETAFQLAEIGLDRHVAAAREIACQSADVVGSTACDLADEPVDDMDGTYTTTTTYRRESSCPGGHSEDEIDSFNFEVRSEGQASNGGATAVHTHGWYICAPSAD